MPVLSKRHMHAALLCQPHLEQTCPSTDREDRHIVAHTPNWNLYSDENKLEPHIAMWVNLTNRVLSKRSQTKREHTI